MTDKERLAEAKRLILLAMDQISRVADAHETDERGEEAEELIASCEEVCLGLDAVSANLKAL